MFSPARICSIVKRRVVRTQVRPARLSRRAICYDRLDETTYASGHVSFQCAFTDAKRCGGFALREPCNTAKPDDGSRLFRERIESTGQLQQILTSCQPAFRCQLIY